MNRIIKYRILITIFLSAFSIALTAQQIAFPGAEGFGRYTTGGRGQSVYYVTNLNDAGVGSLRDALSAGNRTILFKVSGTIYLNSDLKVSKANTTIAGQSAPGDGICIANYTFRVEASNVIVRFIRCRLGDVTKYADDGMDGNGTSPSVTRSNIIIDHCSMSWCLDEAGSFYDNKNFTLQWCILSESLYHSYHPKGDHGYGGIWGGQGASFHHNLLAHHTSRNPRFCGSRYTGDSINEIVDFRNNVLYNWGNINTAYGGEGGNYNMVNNYYKSGPATTKSNLKYRILNYSCFYAATDAAIYPDTVWGGKFYVNGNYVNGYTKTTADNWLGQGSNPGVQIDNAAFKNVMARGQLIAPLSVAPVNTQTPQDAFVFVVATAGATMPKRDTVDRRIARETATGTVTYGGHTYDSAYTANLPSGIIDSQNDVGGWPTLNSRPYPNDTDNDGMPDEWENQRGLNAANATDRNSFNINGYTNLENFLNGDSIIAVGTPNTCINALSVNSSNTGNWLNLKDSSYQRLIATDTMNVVASILDSAINLGIIKTSYFVSASKRLNTFGKPYLNRNITVRSSLFPGGYFKLRLYITNSEWNSLKAVDTALKTINDLKVLFVTDTSCLSSLNTVPAILNPVSTGLWGTYATGYYIDVITNQLGTFFFGSAGSVMPLTLLDFFAIKQNNETVLLSWKTDNEINLQQFIIEKSTDGISFNALSNIQAQNTAGFHEYSSIDAKLVKGITYYRLKMIDNSGAYRYSNTVVFKETNCAVIVMPNPAKEEINVVHGKLNKVMPIKIYSVQGQLLMEAFTNINSDRTKLSIATLIKGTYFLVIDEWSPKAKIFIKE